LILIITLLGQIGEDLKFSFRSYALAAGGIRPYRRKSDRC
jgi:hypothetical protein